MGENIYTSFCNDNRRDQRGKSSGSAFWHGRWWLHVFRSFLRVTWAFGKHAPVTNLGVWFDLVYEKEIGVTFALYHIFYLGIAFHSPRLPYWEYEHGNRSIELRIFDWGIWLDFWRDDDHHAFMQRRVIIKPLDILFGRDKHEKYLLGLHNVIVPMPEKNYPATVEMFISEWTRPRSPFKKRVMRANIKPEQPIPTPGKGENSWDLGEDATYEMMCMADTPEEAVQALIKSVMRDRQKYGGEHWQPSAN